MNNAEKIIKKLIAGGFNEIKAKQQVNKNIAYRNRVYEKVTVCQGADIISRIASD